MLWTCGYCKCLFIASCLDSCPHCHTQRGDNVPKISAQDGPSSRYEEEPVTTPAEDIPGEPVEAPVESVDEEPVKSTRKPRTTSLPGSYEA